jgi:hypothetical protein
MEYLTSWPVLAAASVLILILSTFIRIRVKRGADSEVTKDNGYYRLKVSSTGKASKEADSLEDPNSPAIVDILDSLNGVTPKPAYVARGDKGFQGPQGPQGPRPIDIDRNLVDNRGGSFWTPVGSIVGEGSHILGTASSQNSESYIAGVDNIIRQRVESIGGYGDPVVSASVPDQVVARRLRKVTASLGRCQGGPPQNP